MKAIYRKGAGVILGLCLIAALILSSLVIVPPARAQDMVPGQCLSFPVLTEQLADRFGEAIFFRGEISEGAFMMVAASPDGTWTLFGVSVETNEACIFGFGNRWAGEDLPVQGEAL